MISNGWGTRIRTSTNGVRVRCSTVKLSPKKTKRFQGLTGSRFARGRMSYISAFRRRSRDSPSRPRLQAPRGRSPATASGRGGRGLLVQGRVQSSAIAFHVGTGLDPGTRAAGLLGVSRLRSSAARGTTGPPREAERPAKASPACVPADPKASMWPSMQNIDRDL